MTSSREAGIRGPGLPAARLADVRQPLDRLRLLICESEDTVRQALVDGLLVLNVEVICANDGARALLNVGSRDPDIVLIAADLPPIGAAAVIKAVREISDRHIIVGVGSGQLELASCAVEAGADRVVGRPYAVEELRAILLDFRSSADLARAVGAGRRTAGIRAGCRGQNRRRHGPLRGRRAARHPSSHR